MSAMGHSRPARTGIKFGHVRYAPKATASRFVATSLCAESGACPAQLVSFTGKTDYKPRAGVTLGKRPKRKQRCIQAPE